MNILLLEFVHYLTLTNIKFQQMLKSQYSCDCLLSLTLEKGATHADFNRYL